MVLISHLQDYIDNRPEDVLDYLTPRDVVWVQIYRGVGNGDWHLNARSIDEKLPQFKRNIEFAAEVAKRCFRVIVGNAGCETWMRLPGDDHQTKADRSAHFIRESCLEMRSFGIEPLYVYGDLLPDCYSTDWVVHDTFVELGLIQWSAMVYDAFESPERYGVDREVPPWPYLRGYLEDLECWAGLNFEAGLREGTDEFMKFLGFRAGVMAKGAFDTY